jgi:purine-binding chemotaxis protein CheW
MSIKPEEYLQAQSFTPVASDGGGPLSSAEQAFIHKYVGADAMRTLGAMRQEPDALLSLSGKMPAADDAGAAPAEIPLIERLKQMQTIQMVAFYLDAQIYLIPIVAVSEVLRYTPPVLLPMAPDFVAGVINLRGKVTPLLYLENLLTTPRMERNENRFIIICSHRGLQVGLIFDKVHTMYVFRQDQIIWDVEARIGASAEYIAALVDVNESILGVLSVDMIIDKVLED